MIETVHVPGGSFQMGSADGRPDERPAHVVHVGSFHLGRTPVTRAQYEPFLRTGAVSAPPWWSHPAFDDPAQPVVGVTWFDACAYAAWLGTVLGGPVAAAHGGGMGAGRAWRPRRRADGVGSGAAAR